MSAFSVRLERIRFSHSDAAPILDGADAHLAEGWTGLVGPNGAGKTTVLRLVAGELEPGEGRIRLRPEGARVVLCPQRVDALEVGVRELASRLLDGRAGRAERRIAAGLEVSAGDLVRWPTLSPGERKRWQIAAALASEPDVLLLDEPTNHVDAAARRLLVEELGRFRGVGVVVSHDRALLDGLTSRTLRLEAGALRTFEGSYAAARAAWEREDEAARRGRQAAQDEARRAARKLADARRTRDAAERSGSGRNRDPKDRDSRSIGAKNARSRAEARLGQTVRARRAEAERALAAIPGAPDAVGPGRGVFVGWERPARPVLLALQVGEVRAGDRVVLREVATALGRGDRVRIAGPNGSGKTTLLSAMVAGSTLPPGKLLHLPQELSPGAGRALLGEVRALAPEVRGRVLSLVAALGSDPERLLASEDPSPGEARKLALAFGLGRHAWALVLDEPTNHLDLPAVEHLEEALAAYPGALLLVTHDEALASRVTRATWTISEGMLARS